jgi:TonB family protein
LSGITLTGNGHGSAVPNTTGGGAGQRRPTRPASVNSPKAAPSVRTVSAADLSERPKPPALDGVLAGKYPSELRRQGIGGQAVVSARLDPDGVVRSVSVVSETDSGFGAACRQTVLGSRWSPPRDRRGLPVATLVSYTCRFRIDN